MDTEHFKNLLLAKRRELQSALSALEREASDEGDAEAGDYADAAVNDQGTSDALEQATLLSQTLEQVQDALRRIEDGSYGKCITCGRPIEPARLEALPWTPYCLEDEEKAEGPIANEATL